jgi:hypothetical protein
MKPADHSNPGTVDPANQAYPPALAAQSSPSSAPLAQSTGEQQLPAASACWASASPRGSGLPREVNASSQNLSRPVPPLQAVTSPPAREVQSGNQRPGGLAVEVNVK